jgi:ATP-dependent Clp protease ATP-binding subunit ClpC
MFERFTERARQVVVLAQDEARALRHQYIGTEHLALGLLREEEGLAARVLESFGVTLEAARAEVRAIVGEGDSEARVTGQIPFTPQAKEALELALREALSLGHKYIGTEHVLLGLVRLGQGVGVEILESRGATPEVVREEVIRMLSGPGRVSTGSTVSTVSTVPSRPRPHAVPPSRRQRAMPPVPLLITGWVLFALTLGVGVLIGWAIWG